MKFLLTILLFLGLLSCDQPKVASVENGSIAKAGATETPVKPTEKTPHITLTNPEGQTLQARFNIPNGFTRTEIKPRSFASYLRNLPLKPAGAEVQFYDGGTKPNYDVYEAVVDQGIGKKDLHQCADAVMRLRAEYLWDQEKYEDIHFNFTNGFRVDYAEWMKGKRMIVKGNKTYWSAAGIPSNTYQNFWKYMETIFTYAGTLSLSKELKSVDVADMQIGDVFIQGGSPGHAIIVVDMAVDSTNGKKLFMLAQSYMPAQETQILKNNNQSEVSPWYSLDFGSTLDTPEWNFLSSDLKRFEQ